MIKITKASQNRIRKWFILSYLFSGSNMRFKYNMINVSKKKV